MKKLYTIFIVILLSWCLSTRPGPVPSEINEHDENEVLKKKSVSTLFALYEDDGHIKEISKEFAQSDDPKELIRNIKDEAIEQKNLPIAEKARRDEELINGVVTSFTKTKVNAQWIDRGIGFAAGMGAMAVSLALFYLFQKKPDNEQMAELMRNLNDVLKHGVQMQNGKNGCS